MSALPNEIFYNITNFLPNDDITDLMCMSRTFNTFVTPRLKKIDEQIASTNLSIKSFMPSPMPDRSDNGWISQLNLERFEPTDPEAKQRMKDVFENHVDFRDCLTNIDDPDVRATLLPRLKKKMSLDRFDDPTFLRIVGALVANPKFRQEYNVAPRFARLMRMCYLSYAQHDNIYPNVEYIDVVRILSFYGS